MKTYLTPEQFADLVLTRFDQLVSTMRGGAGAGDNVLNYLFRFYSVQIRETLAASVCDLDQLNDHANLVDVVGPTFHRFFRQGDVISDPTIDMTIWLCLQESENFWQVLEQACRIMTNESKAVLYHLSNDNH